MTKMLTLPPVISHTITEGGARLLRSRRLVRAPIWLYRARLGFLFGSRLLMLEHIGRQSGARRYVVLEVIDHPTPDTYVIASGFGTRAQWFRNVQANPQVRVFVAGHAPAHATARRLTPAEADTSLKAYSTRHPRAWGALKGVIETTLGAPIGDRDTELPMIGLHLRGSRGEC
ncbi:MAG: nitroreductase family deazaflavin-dependent oxidoreductase [Pseudonocardiaceae bacterium]